tara:strand:- start:78 stop:248 length:171 start_codon:yes stop_codon:yes gene_type:complete
MGNKFNLYMKKLLNGETINETLKKEMVKEREKERKRIAEDNANIQRVDNQVKKYFK